jgi:hypothetical protein
MKDALWWLLATIGTAGLVYSIQSYGEMLSRIH